MKVIDHFRLFRFEELRRMPVADASLVIGIGMFILLLPLLFFTIFLAAVLQNFETAAAIVAALWLSTLGYFVWKIGKVTEGPRIMDLRTFHALPVLMLVIAIPHFSKQDDLSYMMGFLDFIIFDALAIYGLICLRLLVMPPKAYWAYIVLNGASFWTLALRA